MSVLEVTTKVTHKSLMNKTKSELAYKTLELMDELQKWENWHPDNETLKALQEQARARDGSYTNGLAALAVYIGALEARLRDITK
jgi:hypothetical protein